jgi:hypothetical protein
MAYIINRYNGTVLTTVEDGTINQTTEVKFVGKNFAGYGESQNENFLFLLENFANSVAPTKPISGMLWYDSATSKIKVYDGSKWKTTGGSEVSGTAPTGLVEGDLWWNSSTNQLYARNSSNEWVLVGPQSAGTGVTQMRSLTVTDTIGVQHAIILATVDDEVVYIISKDEFTISLADTIEGFDSVKKGLTLINTKASTNGVTTSDHRYWGTASNALRLAGRVASEYLTTDNATFAGVVKFGDSGHTIGAGDDLIFSIDTDATTPQIVLVRNALRFKSSTNALIATITNTGLIPGTTNTYNLGAVGNVWGNVYATNFVGTATEAGLLTVGGTGRIASTSATPNTIAARDGSGNLTAVVFNGTATKARYADLAEKYTTEQEWPVGTAMAVCKHSEHETCPAKASDLAIGVISEKPAYLMNSELENGQAIALKGRVPVRIAGPVKKGQAVYAWDAGVCTTMATTALIGVALETDDSTDEKLVECVLKV